MPEVVLIGDSIRMGYQPTVVEHLAGAADVWGPEVNGGHSVNVLLHLHLWVLHRRPALVHVNAGLHDLKTVWYGGRENLVPLDHYRANVRMILRTIRERAGARVIWATTTPVLDDRSHAAHSKWQDFDRYDADVVRYNAAAVEVCRELGVPVNDLYAVVRSAGPERWMTDDGVHFTPDGYAALGAEVARVIRAAVGERA